MKSLTSLIALVAALVLGAGTATAADGIRPDDKAGRIGVGAIAEPQLVERADVVRPDDRAWRGVGPVPTIELTERPSVRGDGFDWADAAIGAAAALAVGLLAGASALALRRHRVAAVS
jgi:hypothetical protein